jgi:hypothetical protein
VDYNEQTIWIAHAHRDSAKRFVVRADEKLIVFLELESAIFACIDFARPAGKISSRLAVATRI